MPLNVETLQDQIPYYLTQEDKDNLVKAFSTFPHSTQYYTSLHETDMLQGDGWTGLGVIEYERGDRKLIRGIILSNSCDIDPKNKRDVPPKVIFAPLLKLQAYVSLLEQAGVAKQSVEDKLKSIRSQTITSIFYLPAGNNLEYEYIVFLDDIHNISYSNFVGQSEKTKLFTLSQVGFYLFLFKLSVHFCRFHENVLRG